MENTLEAFIFEVYNGNPFVQTCAMKLDSAEEGVAVLHMDIEKLHANLYGVAHGGSLASLIDTAMGVAAASVGRRIVTMSLNLSFVRSIAPGERAVATAKVIHSGKSTVVADAEIRNRYNELIAKSTGTLFVVGKFAG